MKLEANILKNNWVTHLVMVLCLTTAIVNTQYAQDTSINADQSEESAENQQSEEENTTSLSEAVQTGSVQINLDFSNVLLDVVLLDKLQHIRANIVDQFSIAQSKSIKLLFRTIISPNAP